MAVTPLFLLSLPRSGSTLLQRLLSGHEAIATTAEPWLLLPLVYALRERGVYAEYGHWGACRALSDFASGLPGGRTSYDASLRTFALELYAKASERTRPEATFFLDKTPRYSLIAQDLGRLFPEARFVYLWRNPLAIVASIIETWGQGRWRIHPWRVDLFKGLSSLLDAYVGMRDTALALRYEDLVQSPDAELSRLGGYLGLDLGLGTAAPAIDSQVRGRFGDQDGSAHYDKVSTASLTKWRGTLSSPARKAWCGRYLRWIGRDRLKMMGYDLDGLLDDLASAPQVTRGTLSDLSDMVYGSIASVLEPRIIKHKLSSSWGITQIYRHN